MRNASNREQSSTKTKIVAYSINFYLNKNLYIGERNIFIYSWIGSEIILEVMLSSSKIICTDTEFSVR